HEQPHPLWTDCSITPMSSRPISARADWPRPLPGGGESPWSKDSAGEDCCPSVRNSRVRRWGGQLSASGEFLVAIHIYGTGPFFVARDSRSSKSEQILLAGPLDHGEPLGLRGPDVASGMGEPFISHPALASRPGPRAPALRQPVALALPVFCAAN